MSTRIEVGFQSGATLYCVIHSPLDNKVWNTNTLAFETYNSANWDKYATLFTEALNSGYYSVAYPSGIVNVVTTEAVYQRQGMVPALSDAVNGPIGLGQSQGVNLVEILGDSTATTNFKTALNSEITGSAISGVLSKTQMTTTLSDVLNNVYVGRIVIWTSGTLIRQVANITGYNGTTKMLTFTSVTTPPSAADEFIIL